MVGGGRTDGRTMGAGRAFSPETHGPSTTLSGVAVAKPGDPRTQYYSVWCGCGQAWRPTDPVLLCLVWLWPSLETHGPSGTLHCLAGTDTCGHAGAQSKMP
ncbi:hypothetical protein NHX12_019260 [Muraenolepis orangiensis]|uniref:Uncharacterized protein n=1 Tax=Muraenolepis orangiensis TaxID=630683 RepID=A0A9Q0IX19_9TELE|nr:hypothetical protein NHX12_019260 [Muraenolepis orangiensis]